VKYNILQLLLLLLYFGFSYYNIPYFLFMAAFFTSKIAVCRWGRCL